MHVSGTELSAGVSSAASSAGSPVSHRDGASLPDAPSPSPSGQGQKDPSHGRTGSNASEKMGGVRYNPIARGSPGASNSAAPSNGAASTTGPRTRRRAGTTGGVKKEKEEMRAAALAAAAAKEEEHDSDDEDLDYLGPSAGKSDK
jgi:hypothetical protein